MAPHDINSQVMHWQPRLIKLTMVGNREVDTGKPTTCFVDPHLIIGIYRSCSRWFKPGTKELEDGPGEQCTCVQYAHGHTLSVLEIPEEVARLRDEALGHQAPQPSPLRAV